MLLSSQPRGSDRCFDSLRDPICFTRDQIYGVFMGLWAKTERFWIRGMRQENVWHLKFRSSEICVWCYVSEFQFQKLGKLKKTKGLGRILPSGRRLPYHQLQSLLFELQNLPWYRSVDLGFACCGLWFEFWLLEEFLLGFVELGFRIALEFEGSSSSVQTGSIILPRIASSLNFFGSWIFMEAWCVAIGFLEK